MIEHATQDDIPALADMLFALNALHAQNIPHRFHIEGAHDDVRAFLTAAMEEGARILLYRTAGVPRGYLKWDVQDQPANALVQPVRRAVLDHIFVEPLWRRRGLAQRLIARFEAEIRSEGLTGWISRVHAFNRSSAGLMQSAGAELTLEVYERRF